MSKIAQWAATHRKALLAYAGFAMTILTAVSQAEHWHLTWLPLVAGALAAIGVHVVGNAKPPSPAIPQVIAPTGHPG